MIETRPSGLRPNYFRCRVGWHCWVPWESCNLPLYREARDVEGQQRHCIWCGILKKRAVIVWNTLRDQP